MSDFPSIGDPAPSYRPPDTVRVGRVRLAISNLERSIRFYPDVIGLALLKESKAAAQLGVSTTYWSCRRFPVYRPSGAEVVPALIPWLCCFPAEQRSAASCSTSIG
jgi:hypothetical protein